MHDICEQMAETLDRILSDRTASKDFVPGQIDLKAADLLAEAGFEEALLSSMAGGYDLLPSDFLPTLRVIGKFPALTPTVDRMFGRWLAGEAGLACDRATFASGDGLNRFNLDIGGWHLAGHAVRIPWARQGDPIAIVRDTEEGSKLAILTPAAAKVIQGSNLGGEPRDTVTLDDVVAAEMVGTLPATLNERGVRANAAAIRCQQLAGAAAHVLALTFSYVNERQQFGRPLARFQAIQHQIATMAGEVVAAGAAADIAAEAFGVDPDIEMIAVAKIRCGEAAGKVAGAAHQLHGAIGYTEEHRLHRHTKLLFAWRDEYGGEASWARILGEQVIARSANGLWSTLVPAQAPVLIRKEAVDA